MLAGEAAAAAPGPIAVAPVHRGLPLQVLADGDEFHLGRDDALAGVVHLGDVAAGLRPQRLAEVREPQGVQLGIGQAQAPVLRGDAGQLFHVPRAMIQASRSGRRPRRMSSVTSGSVYGPDVS